jgi:hypothetical protein
MGVYQLLVEGNLGKRDHLKDLGIDGSIIFKWILKVWDGRACAGLIWFRVRTCGRPCDHGNEPLSFIKCGEFVD